MTQSRMKLIGVTGGIGAGKSEVLAYLERRWQARTIRLDDISRGLLEKDGACYGDAVKLFGKDIVRDDGALDRGAIAQRIMGNEELRRKLDALIHPLVKKKALSLVGEYRRQGCPLCVMEAALLIEEHYDEICDELWYIYASEKTRMARLIASRGYDEERISRTFRRQLSEGEFRKHADFVLDNDGDFSVTCGQIDKRLMK